MQMVALSAGVHLDPALHSSVKFNVIQDMLEFLIVLLVL
jgi:hypothetical protein